MGNVGQEPNINAQLATTQNHNPQPTTKLSKRHDSADTAQKAPVTKPRVQYHRYRGRPWRRIQKTPGSQDVLALQTALHGPLHSPINQHIAVMQTLAFCGTPCDRTPDCYLPPCRSYSTLLYHVIELNFPVHLTSLGRCPDTSRRCTTVSRKSSSCATVLSFTCMKEGLKSAGRLDTYMCSEHCVGGT